MLTVCCWKWGALFGPEYVNRLRAMLERHVRLEHELVCVTEDPTGIDARVRIVPLPETLRDTPRCRRRMRIFDGDFAAEIGDRILSIDLDVVIVGDLTPLVSRRESLVLWRVQHAQVYSGSFVLMNAGVLDPLWQAFASDPDGYPRRVQATGVPSDQAMLNHWLRGRYVGGRAHAPRDTCQWTERDGFVTYFGAGYERLEHLGVGPAHPTLPAGARIVVLGSADKAVMDEGQFEWVREHWREDVGAEVRAS